MRQMIKQWPKQRWGYNTAHDFSKMLLAKIWNMDLNIPWWYWLLGLNWRKVILKMYGVIQKVYSLEISNFWPPPYPFFSFSILVVLHSMYVCFSELPSSQKRFCNAYEFLNKRERKNYFFKTQPKRSTFFTQLYIWWQQKYVHAHKKNVKWKKKCLFDKKYHYMLD